jgi:serine/threonine-protein kinase
MMHSPGDKLGPYEILTQIGAGGMGEVYKARDTRLDRIVAIKVAKAEFSERFEREARAVAALNHPYICQLYDVGANHLVMEYIEGVPLDGPLPLDHALKYAAQICGALDAAHKKNIIHRDLKPANILVTKAGVKLLDFGLAKMRPVLNGDGVTRTMALTGKNEIVGTLVYMSPEQLQGKDADARSDIFSFGLVLYEILTGKRAFNGDNAASIIAAILERPAPSVAPVAPAALDRVLQRCLAKDPEDRWQSVRDLRAALEWTIAGPEPGSTVGAAIHPSSRLSKLWPVSTAIFAGVAAAALWAWLGSEQRMDRPLMRLDVSLGDAAVSGLDSSVAISPDGTILVFPIRGADGKPMLAFRQLNQAAITALPGTEKGTHAFFSPDGQWIGFFADSRLKKISLHGGVPITLCDVATTEFLGASWGESDDIVAPFRGYSGLESIPASGGTAGTVTTREKEENTHRWPQVLPGGRTVLFTAARTTSSFEDAKIEAVSLKTGAKKTVISGGYLGRYLPTAGSSGHLVYVHQGALYAVPFDPVRLEARGSPSQILEDVAGGFDFSRNGTFVYHASAEGELNRPVVWMDSAGAIQPLVRTPGNYSWPKLSPDGTRLALSADAGKGEQVFVFDLRTDTMSQLTFANGMNIDAYWSQDGENLVFESRSTTGSRLIWIRSDGSGENQVLLESKNSISPTGISPDGRRMAYREVKPDGDIDLWILPLDLTDPRRPKAGKPMPFLQTAANETRLGFSPDNRYVAYMSNESGRYDIYVRKSPGPDGKPGPGKWQVSSDGGMFPVWSPTGHGLFYRGFDNRIMFAEYTATDTSFASSKPRVWSDRQIQPVGNSMNFTISPDGKRFAVFPVPDAKDRGAAHVTFLLNFFDELRRRVPAGR